MQDAVFLGTRHFELWGISSTDSAGGLYRERAANVLGELVLAMPGRLLSHPAADGTASRFPFAGRSLERRSMEARCEVDRPSAGATVTTQRSGGLQAGKITLCRTGVG